MEEKYNELIKELVGEFKETIPNPENESELIDSFEKYLQTLQKGLEEQQKDHVEDGLRFLAGRTSKLPLLHKKQKLITDKSFEKIRSTSRKAYSMAEDVLRGKKVEIEDNEIEKMQEELTKEVDNVRDFNEYQAKMLVSEGILDLRFLQDPKTTMMSLRLGRQIRIKKNVGEEKK